MYYLAFSHLQNDIENYIKIIRRRELCMLACVNQEVQGALLLELKREVCHKYGIQINNSICEVNNKKYQFNQLIGTINWRKITKMGKVISAEEVFVSTKPKMHGII